MTVQSGSRVRIPLFPRKLRKQLNDNNLRSFSDPRRDRIGTSLQLFDELISDTFLEKDEVAVYTESISVVSRFNLLVV